MESKEISIDYCDYTIFPHNYQVPRPYNLSPDSFLTISL